VRRLSRWSLAAALTLSCAPKAPPATAPTAAAFTSSPLWPTESAFQDLRYLADQVKITRYRAASTSIHGDPLATLVLRNRSSQSGFRTRLVALDTLGLDAGDRHALKVMRDVWTRELSIDPDSSASVRDSVAPDCAYDPHRLADPGGAEGIERLSQRLYACYGRAAESASFEGRVLGRLAIIGLLGQTDDPSQRHQLFMALEPVWRSVNRGDEFDSPYRELVRRRAEESKRPNSLLETRAEEFGIPADTLEQWLVAILERWHASTPADELEPWDFYYANGAVERRLNGRIPLERLRAINDTFYHRLGADPTRLAIHYDLEPRAGKDPVAFTDFGARQRFADGRWLPGEAWVFSSYSVGGYNNLAELLHETGHGLHITAIRTRPALNDWPESDTFTEALADLFADEAYEPVWQWRYLGDSASTGESMREKYGSTVLGIALALFEVRMYRDPTLDPNRVWADLTSRYLRIKPHPELSWWALRGQLIDAPGYLMNYAIGSMITEDLRGRMVQLRGSFATADSTWYPWITERIYRFGLERLSRDVLEGFLGRPMSPKTLLEDMGRMGKTQ